MCIVLCKIGTCSCKKVVRKSAMTGEKDSSGESGDLHCVYRQKDNRIWTGSLVKLPLSKMHAKLSIAMCSRVLLTSL